MEQIDGLRGTPSVSVFELGHWSFLAFRLSLKHWLFSGLEPDSFHTGTYPVTLSNPPVQAGTQIGSSEFPACMWLISLHNSVSKLLIINESFSLSFYLHTDIDTLTHPHTHIYRHAPIGSVLWQIQNLCSRYYQYIYFTDGETHTKKLGNFLWQFKGMSIDSLILLSQKVKVNSVSLSLGWT